MRVVLLAIFLRIGLLFDLAAQPAVYAGGNHSLFLKTDGTVWAAGQNSSGQLGNGTTTNRSTPVQVMTGVSAVSAGYENSLFLKTDDTVWAAGQNRSGQLGNGTTTNRSTPVQVMTGVSAISTGVNHSMFLKTDGTVWATGGNWSGQLGDGSTTNRSTPVRVMNGVSAICASGNHTLFLKADGTVWAAGQNGSGQLGDGSTTNRSTPVLVMTGVSAISAGSQHSLFLKTDGTVWATGYNFDGQLGDGSSTNRSTPVLVMTGVSAVSASGNHSLFLKTDGTVWANGKNSFGQLGNGSSTNRSTPVLVMTGVSAISAGSQHSLFLKTDGSVWATGYNISGQIGDGSTTNRNTPVQTLLSLGQIIPVITVQPRSTATVASASTRMSVSVAAAGAITYQWQLNGLAISGATNATYTISSVQVSDAGSYTCVVSNGYVSAVSNPANLTVYTEANLTIRTQPTPEVSSAGNSATFSLIATSIEHIGYQWRKNGIAITGATSSNYTISALTTNDAGTYSCIVSDYDELLLSSGATLTVHVPPALNSHPSSLTVLQNASATFSVTSTGAPVPTYQWQLNGVDISGATSASYTIASAQAASAGSYTCVVTNVAGSVTSSAATLTVQIPPAITVQPTSLSVLQNSAAVFNITAMGTPAPTYQWKFNGTSISGATETSYSIALAQPANAGNYTCVVSNAAGSVTSNIATLIVNIPVAITAQPASLSVNPAASATFGVTATGTGPLGYQWRKNGRDIAGAAASTLSLTNVRFLDEAEYTCVVSNSFGTAISTAAALTIAISPTSADSDGDGISDALETYLSVFGLDPAVDSTEEWTRLLAMIPELGAYYTADQMRDLAVGSPTLQRGANGNFLLDVTVQESTDLNTWTKRTLSAPMLTYPGGVLRLELPPLDSSTQFYRLRSQPAP